MLFNSLTFVIFFIVVLLLHNMPFSWRVKKTNLLIGSYLFYAAWNPAYLILILVSTLIDYATGIGMEQAVEQPGRGGHPHRTRGHLSLRGHGLFYPLRPRHACELLRHSCRYGCQRPDQHCSQRRNHALRLRSLQQLAGDR